MMVKNILTPLEVLLFLTEYFYFLNKISFEMIIQRKKNRYVSGYTGDPEIITDPDNTCNGGWDGEHKIKDD